MLTVVRQVLPAMRELDVYHLIAFCLHDACRLKERHTRPADDAREYASARHASPDRLLP
jgi:hypothetical protein